MSSELKLKIGRHTIVTWKPIVLDDSVDFIHDGELPGHTKFTRRFIPDADGTMSVVEGNGATVAIPCKQGIPVDGIIKRFRLTGTTASLGGPAGT